VPKKTLTDRGLKALKPATKLYDVMDTITPGFGVRVSERGRKTFILIARYPGSTNPTRRSLGEYGAVTLEMARNRARAWLELIRQGKDPVTEAERQKQAEERKRANSFAAVAEDFINEKLSLERQGTDVEREIRREFLPSLGQLPITEITPEVVVPIIKRKKTTAPAQARNLLGTLKRLVAWAADQHCYGISASPLTVLKASAIIGDKAVGDRVLDDDELFALWRAARRMRYPHGPIYQLLVLTALRLNEVADASWPELDLDRRIWVIPAERMKGKTSKARPHAVPLMEEILAILKCLPRFKRGSFLFSTTYGEKPVWMTDKVKRKLDARILRTLRALARKRGRDPEEVQLKPWTNHDIRRTVRSHLSRLKISEEAREAVLSHARPGIKGVYDRYEYFDEKHEALTLWAARLRSIVELHRPDVIPLAKGGRGV
jgi:integrase